ESHTIWIPAFAGMSDRKAGDSARRQRPLQFGDRHALDRARFRRRAHGGDLDAGGGVDGRAFHIGAVADELDDDLAEFGVGRHAATGRRATLQCDQSLSMASTRRSIMPSSWSGYGVKPRRSVPLGTVG